MILIKKDLKTVKNKLLCELEDYIFDSVMPLMTNASNMTEEKQEQLSTEMMKSVMDAIKDNSIRFATICYTDENGQSLSEEDLQEIPLKLKVFQECLPEIMEIMADYLQNEDSAEQGKPKRKIIRKK